MSQPAHIIPKPHTSLCGGKPGILSDWEKKYPARRNISGTPPTHGISHMTNDVCSGSPQDVTVRHLQGHAVRLKDLKTPADKPHRTAEAANTPPCGILNHAAACGILEPRRRRRTVEPRRRRRNIETTPPQAEYLSTPPQADSLIISGSKAEVGSSNSIMSGSSCITPAQSPAAAARRRVVPDIYWPDREF